MSNPEGAVAEVLIDLVALRKNYRLLRQELASGVELAAVVKADAYGLGTERVVPVLIEEGCTTFFVATLEEGFAVRRVAKNSKIYVLNGVTSSDVLQDFCRYGIRPVLNDLGQVDRWVLYKGREPDNELTAAIQIDTGMTRYGMSDSQIPLLKNRLGGLYYPSLIMSHLACADEEKHELNHTQLRRFIGSVDSLNLRKNRCKLSLANSSGIFLGYEYHFNLARAGAALYGINPQPNKLNKMSEVLHLKAKIAQVRFVDSPTTVGYGAVHHLDAPARVATVPVGYADGFLRSLGGKAKAFIGGTYVPVIGRVSMDAITLDISGVAEDLAREGANVELIGPRRPLDVVAREAGTIGYEILTRISRRIRRVYIDSSSGV
jgi:alanine racemase